MSNQVALLVTVPASNYCEKARWGLRLAKVKFEEEMHAPIFHYLSTVPKNGKSVPLLYFPDTKSTLTNSDDILTHCGKILPSLYPNDKVKEKELYFDNEFGPHARRYAYHLLFSMGPSGKCILTNPLDGSRQKFLVELSYPLLKTALTRAMTITEEESELSWVKLLSIFDEVDIVLGDAPLGTKFLAGSTFSAADISFCSHASLLIVPPQNQFLAPYLQVDQMPSQFRERYEALMKSKASQFVVWCYSNHYPTRFE